MVYESRIHFESRVLRGGRAIGGRAKPDVVTIRLLSIKLLQDLKYSRYISTDTLRLNFVCPAPGRRDSRDVR